MWAPELAKAIATRCKATFDDRRAEASFATNVTATLRRLAGKGVVDVVERDATGKHLKWKLRVGTNGRLSVH
jgi:hypothetical protein